MCRSLPPAGERLCAPPGGKGLPVPPTFFPPYVSAHSGPAFKKHNSAVPPPPDHGPQLGPSFAQTLENTVLFYVFDGWKGAKCRNLLDSEAILIPI